jgi:hypothetical protein
MRLDRPIVGLVLTSMAWAGVQPTLNPSGPVPSTPNSKVVAAMLTAASSSVTMTGAGYGLINAFTGEMPRPPIEPARLPWSFPV